MADQRLLCATLEAQLESLPFKDQIFAKSLLAGYKKYGNLSDKQAYWVGKLVDRAQGFDAVPPPEQVGNFAGVMSLFLKAKQNLKYPKLHLQIADKEVELSLAGSKSKAPGTLNVTDGKPFGANVWYGRVDTDGGWTQGHSADEDAVKVVRRLLQSLAADPAGAATKYGKLTGRCMFCNLPLSDEKSTAAGFGPTCAKNWGLHDQWKAASAVLEAA